MNFLGFNTIEKLAEAIARASKRGEWYDGPASTNIVDWLEEGDLDGMTVEQLVAEWDE